MAFRNTWSLVALAVIFIGVMSPLVVKGRLLSEDFAGENNLDTYSSSVYETAKNGVSYWLQQLESGPSPSGPGH
ncbi:hypothetical protein CTI12_AA265360 [Artemisia annua]|uniref:Uncharacterized protein n=1 Tax=Artemisia annua TaxID=35608 RepID=A0A2U1NHM7_ARTAN|nr:hypothetical protein CTI12_AA222910 [Artemisia annua]PWA73014.1 hypothetical protein CTI12_AA265360 [Artemisia annua]